MAEIKQHHPNFEQFGSELDKTDKARHILANIVTHSSASFRVWHRQVFIHV